MARKLPQPTLNETKLLVIKKYKEIEELKDYYWAILCHELYAEAEKELYPNSKFWERFTGIFGQKVKELQYKKFEELWSKMTK